MTDKRLLYVGMFAVTGAAALAGYWLGRRGNWIAVVAGLAVLALGWAGFDSIGRAVGGMRGMGWSLGALTYILPPGTGFLAGALLGGIARVRRRR